MTNETAGDSLPPLVGCEDAKRKVFEGYPPEGKIVEVALDGQSFTSPVNAAKYMHTIGFTLPDAAEYIRNLPVIYSDEPFSPNVKAQGMARED